MDKPRLYSKSIKGRRNTNQDTCIAMEEGNLTFLAVADGMGGASGGEIASQTVIEVCKNHIIQAAKKSINPENLKSILDKIYEECQWHLSIIIHENPALSGMGTTLSCVLLMENRFVWGNIGDSRVYRFKGQELRQITVDHSLIEEYRSEYGNDIPDYVKSRSNVITRSIGNDKDDPDIFPERKEFEILNPGEGLLICSDGLIPEKTIDDIAWLSDILLGTKNLRDAAQHMVSTSFENGSTDNISVVLFEYGKFKRIKSNFKNYLLNPVSEEDRKNEKKPGSKNTRAMKRSSTPFLLKLAGVFVSVLIGASVYWLFQNNNYQEETETFQLTPVEEIRQQHGEDPNPGFEIIESEEAGELDEPVQPEKSSEIDGIVETENEEPEIIEPEEAGETDEPVQPEKGSEIEGRIETGNEEPEIIEPEEAGELDEPVQPEKGSEIDGIVETENEEPEIIESEEAGEPDEPALPK